VTIEDKISVFRGIVQPIALIIKNWLRT
jgi:hypothetical protein